MVTEEEDVVEEERRDRREGEGKRKKILKFRRMVN